MHSRDGDVQRINARSGRHPSLDYQNSGQPNGLQRDFQQWEGVEHLEPSPGSLWIARARFIQHGLGDEQVEGATAVVPPVVGDLLVSGHYQVATGPCRQVADQRCFQTDGGPSHDLPPLADVLGALLGLALGADLGGQHHLGLLHLGQRPRAAGRHREPQRADQVHGAVVLVGWA